MYFLYPETSGVRLEDMDSIFGDATTTAPTPATQAERDSLFGVGSPVPSLDIRRGGGVGGPTSALSGFPGLDVDPPPVSVVDGKVQSSHGPSGSRGGSGLAGWISSMIQRGRGRTQGNKGHGVQYRRLLEGEDEG